MVGSFNTQKLARVVPARGKTLGSDCSEEEHQERASFKERCLYIIDNKHFQALTLFLTIYALFGDDVRLGWTPVAADSVFNAITIIAIFIFGFEACAASLLKAGYLFGFFFWLDLISTSTLVLDLTWIGNLIACSTDDDTLGNTGRAGRAGARASRVVRIIRLVRLVKLYKQYMESQAKKRKQLAMKAAENAEVDDMDGEDEMDMYEEAEDAEDAHHSTGPPLARGMSQTSAGTNVSNAESNNVKKNADAETRVGKKLSEKTTQRVIILILVMLIAMPAFSLDGLIAGAEELPHSAAFGVDVLYNRWRYWCPLAGCIFSPLPDAPATTAAADARSWYEEALVSFIYSHKADGYSWRLFWLGASSPNLTALGRGNEVSEYARLGQTRFLGAGGAGPADWDSLVWNEKWPTSSMVPPLKSSVKQRLAEPWAESCNGFTGVLLSDELEPMSQGCTPQQELRCTEVIWVKPLAISAAERGMMAFTFVFDRRPEKTFESTCNILRTIFIMFAVGLGSVAFNNDANELLLNPIQRMIAKMETIKDNPLEAIKLGDLEFKREQLQAAKHKEEFAQKHAIVRLLAKLQPVQGKSKEPMETVILEKTIIRLGGLLALGFGETGADIVGPNTTKGGSSIELNPAALGRKVDIIVGICEPNDMSLTAEALKEEVTLYLNQIAAIVHGCVDDYHGAPIKNFGQSFLVVWRVTELGTTEARRAKVADMALLASVYMQVVLRKTQAISEYSEHPALISRFGSFQVSLGIALHFGWALEGAIGSDLKIDPVFVAPCVAVCGRLEHNRREYRVPIVMSDRMLSICTPPMAALCRLIDHVTVKGSRKPIRLFTMDLDLSSIKCSARSVEGLPKNRFKIRQIREQKKLRLWDDDIDMWSMFTKDKDLIAMRASYSQEFFMRFATAFRNYEAGQWLVARDLLLTCHYQPLITCASPASPNTRDWPVDGPSQLLLAYMRDHGDYTPPSDWKGQRALEVPGTRMIGPIGRFGWGWGSSF